MTDFAAIRCSTVDARNRLCLDSRLDLRPLCVTAVFPEKDIWPNPNDMLAGKSPA